MTRKEAIAVFNSLAIEMTAILAGIPKNKSEAKQIQRYIDAFDMAISALRQQDVTDKYVGKMTNAQKIRAMNDEELAEFLWDFNLADVSTVKMGEFGPHMFRYRLKEWLKMPAKEDKHEDD